MKAKFSRRDFHKITLLSLGAASLAACERLVKATPTDLPTLTVPPPETVTTQPTNTSLPETRDIPIYKNSFEGITDLAANGITSANNGVRINTENVDYQSGSQSLEAYGTIAGPIYSTLTIEFLVKKLTGEDAVDLSNKTVGFYFFVPADSPITSINFVAKAGMKTVSLAGSSNFTTGEWHHLQSDLKSVYDNAAWIWTDLSNDEARDVIKHCQELMITGMRTSEGAAAPTSFLVDDLNWIGINDLNHIALNDSVDSIRKYANLNHHKIGAVLNIYTDCFSDAWYLYTLAREFNLTDVGGVATPETKPEDISAFNFDYTDPDQKLAFVEGNGMFLRGGTGGYGVGNPLWLTDASYDELKAFLERKIEQDLTHYRGKVISWGVFNEPVNDAGDGFRNRQNKNPSDPYASSWAPYGYSYSPYVDGNDTSLIEAALIKARQVDPNAMLYINDFNNEEIGKQKSEFFYNFLIGMRDKGVPIDGGGFELHLSYPNLPGHPDLEDLEAYLDRVDRNIKRYAAAGLMVEFTEVECQIRLDDIDLATQAGQDEYARRAQKQADIYAGLMKLVVENPNVLAFTFWTVADKPHKSAFDAPFFPPFTYTDSFLFDKNYNPKPAYYAVLGVLKGR